MAHWTQYRKLEGLYVTSYFISYHLANELKGSATSTSERRVRRPADEGQRDVN